MEGIFIIFLMLLVVAAGGAALFFWRQAGGGQNKITQLQTQLDNESARRGEADAARDALQNNYEQVREELNTQIKTAVAQISKLETELKNAKENADREIKLLKEVRESMGAEFKNLSQNILEEKGKNFDEHNQKLLEPLRENLQSFRSRMDEIHGEQTRERATLKSEIAGLQKNTAQVGKDATTLALALKGGSKTQGDWGEVQLASLLEKSGLREGEEYTTQKTVRGEDGVLLRPDVLIKLPDNKHLIVDSKVSLRDYHAAVAADEDKETERAALARHVAAIKNHIADLSGKHYARAKGMNTPDFVFMFMPMEAAFFAALKKSPSLFSDSFDKRIILCAPTTLMATLRTVERLWRLEKQNRNAEEIARQGGGLYDKFATFLESMSEIDNAISKARASYDKAYKQIGSGGGNLIGRVEKLRDLGVSPKKAKLVDSKSEDLAGGE